MADGQDRPVQVNRTISHGLEDELHTTIGERLDARRARAEAEAAEREARGAGARGDGTEGGAGG